MRTAAALTLGVLAGLSWLTAQAAAGDAVTGAGVGTVELLYHADLDGQLATPRCDQAGRAGPDYAAIVAVIAAARARATTPEGAPIVLLGGNQLGPDLFADTLLQRGADGARDLAALLGRGGYDAVALGHHELSLPPERLEAVLRALIAQGPAVIATNLRCSGVRQGLCALLHPELLVRRGASLVGVLASISPSVLPGIAPDRRGGLTLEDPVTAVRAGVRRLRARGATQVVLMVQGPRDTTALDEIDGLARRLGTTDAPDLILGGGLFGEEPGRAIRLVQRESTPPIVGGSAGARGLTSVVLSPSGGPPPVVTPLPAEPERVDGDTQRRLAPVIAAYCAHYGVPLGIGSVRGPISRDDFVRYALQVMRRRAGAEIALVNRALVKGAPFPIAGPFTRAELYRALPFQAVIGVARIPGAAVEQLLGPLASQPRAALLGVEGGAGGLKINGRALDKTRAYRIATIAFVAGGGDNLVAAGALPWQALPGTPDLRDEIAHFMATQAGSADGDPTIDPRTDFGPPADARPLIVGLTDLGLDLLNTAISNGPGYGDAQLVRATQTSFKGEITTLVQLRLPVHEADARFNAKYGWSRSQPPGMPSVSGETTDLVTFTTIYNYRGLRALGALPRRAIPDPYVRAGLESELTRPEVTPTQLRDFHHLELTGTAGTLFTLSPKLKLRGGAGVRRELLAPGDLGRWRPLLEAGGTLDPIAIATLGTLAARLEGLVDYALVDPAGTREHQLRSSGKLSFPLVPLLFLTVGVDLFAVQRERQGWGTSYDTTVGLRIHLDAAHQGL